MPVFSIRGTFSIRRKGLWDIHGIPDISCDLWVYGFSSNYGMRIRGVSWSVFASRQPPNMFVLLALGRCPEEKSEGTGGKAAL